MNILPPSVHKLVWNCSKSTTTKLQLDYVGIFFPKKQEEGKSPYHSYSTLIYDMDNWTNLMKSYWKKIY